MSAIQSSHVNYLKGSAYFFSQEKIPEGKRVFTLVCTGDRRDEIGVYFFLWRNKGSPLGNSDFGKWCFHDQRGITSTSQEKANAIYSYLINHHQTPFFTPPPSLNTFFHSLDRPIIERSSVQAEIPSEIVSEETDYSYYILIGTAALSTATLALSLFSGRGGGNRDLPSLSGHVTVGGGHFPFSQPIQRLTEAASSIASRISPSNTLQTTTPVRQTNRIRQPEERISLVVDDSRDPHDSRATFHHQGTWHREDPSNKWQGSLEQQAFERGIAELQNNLRQIESQLAPDELREIQHRIQDLESQLELIHEKSFAKIVEILECTIWVYSPKGRYQWTDIFPLSRIFQKFKEFGDIGYASKDIRAELHGLLEMQRSLEAANEANRLNELRAR